MKPVFITQEAWETLTWKEQDFIVFRYIRWYSKTKLKRKLYITTDVWLWKIQKKITEIIKNNSVNKITK